MRDVAMRLEGPRRSEFRRFLAASGALHLLAFAALVLSPDLPSVAPPAVVAVRLVSPPGAEARPTPAPVRPKPKPKPPKPAPVVLPSEPTTPRPQAKPAPKPAPKPKPKPEPPPEAPPQEEEYTDVLDQLRSELGEEAPPQQEQPSQVAAVTGSVDGVAVSAEMAAWIKRVRVHVKRSWVVPQAFEMLSLVAEISVELDAAGNVVGDPDIVRSSRNPWYDENVVRSIRKASPLPAPPQAGRWTFDFYSDRD